MFSVKSGNEGYWINYATNKEFPISEHETWVRQVENAKKLGIPKSVIDKFGKFKYQDDRDKFLVYLMNHAPVMRVRGHGGYTTFEFASHSRRDPMDSIYMWAMKNAGDYTQLNIVNFATHESVAMYWKDFKETADREGYDGVLRAASQQIKASHDGMAKLASELTGLAEEIVSAKEDANPDIARTASQWMTVKEVADAAMKEPFLLSVSGASPMFKRLPLQLISTHKTIEDARRARSKWEKENPGEIGYVGRSSDIPEIRSLLV